ncbi:MAG: MCE family protein [Myxococcales bacterium]|nr:MCE family protein [Myxococcales bacterium]
MPLPRSSEIKVGLFALVVLVAFLASIVVLTSKTSLFRESIDLRTSFKDIAGLIEGSEVRLSGVTVGFVNQIQFSPEKGDPTVFVSFNLDDRGIDRVMKDSKVTISSLGLLGKKYLEIMPGTLAAGRVENDDFLEGINPASMAEALDKAGVVLDNIRDTTFDLKKLFASIAGEEGAETDLSRSITSVRNIMAEVEGGRGVLHDLIYEPTKAEILTNIAATTRRINTVVARIEEGPGNIHEIVYGQQVKALMDNLSTTSEALRQVMVDLKEEKGLIHGLIYDPEKYQMLEDLKMSAANLARITERMDQGEGTIGGLLIDPTIYEDLKKLTGEVERNRVLKTYIRYVVRKREMDLEKSMEPPPNPPADSTPVPDGGATAP